jgi:hypothetical protein
MSRSSFGELEVGATAGSQLLFKIFAAYRIRIFKPVL